MRFQKQHHNDLKLKLDTIGPTCCMDLLQIDTTWSYKFGNKLPNAYRLDTKILVS